jgi:hypothetical protein
MGRRERVVSAAPDKSSALGDNGAHVVMADPAEREHNPQQRRTTQCLPTKHEAEKETT